MSNYHESWKPLFDEFIFDLDQVYIENDSVYPPKHLIFKVFEMDVREIRVVLLGQDPYHGPNQAHGLSFSVPTGINIPPSLRNIHKELKIEFPERNYCFQSGNLESWFYREKIFLLNAALTVIKGKPGSMMHFWQEFTNRVIQFISQQNDTCVFLLLGNFAKAKEGLIENKERIVKGIHPSPMSANRGFFGSGIFKQVEEKLGQKINWCI
jgi:uracil-DNA glycosylase